MLARSLILREHYRVVVDVDDVRRGDDLLGDLVHVALGGPAGADVEELVDAAPASQWVARCRKRWFSQTTSYVTVRPSAASTLAAATRSTSKLSLPPRK
jgi:hypothetical protein